MAIRKKGKPDGRTTFGKTFRDIEEHYIRALGGDPALRVKREDQDKHCGLSPQLMDLIDDLVWDRFFLMTINSELMSKKRLTRKGKPHSLIALRLTITRDRRETFKLTGVKCIPRDTIDLAAEIRRLQDPSPTGESAPASR